MTLKHREDEIPLNLGMDTKQSAEMQAPGSMRLVQNLHWRGLGEIEKRPVHGVSASVTANSGSEYAETESCGLIVRENDVCVVSGRHGVMPYSTKQSALKYNRLTVTTSSTPDALGYCPVNYEVSRRFVHSAQFNNVSRGIGSVTTSQYNGIQVMAWVEIHSSVNRVTFQAIDVDTGTVLASTEYITTTGASQYLVSCVYQETGKEGVLIAFIDGTSAPFTVKTMRYDAASNEFVADSNLTTNAMSTWMALINLDGLVVFAFTDNTSGFLVAQHRTIGSISTTHTGTHGAELGVCLLRGATRVLIASCTATTAYVETLTNPANVLTLHTASSETFMYCYAALESVTGGSGNDAVAYVMSTTTAAAPAAVDGVRTKLKEVNFDAAAPTAGVSRSLPHVVPLGAFTLQGMAHLVAGLYITFSGVTTGRAVSCQVMRYRSGRHDAVARVCHDRFFANINVFLGQLQITSVSGTNAWIFLPADPGADSLGGYYPQTLFLERISAARPMPMPYVSPSPTVTLSAGGQLWEFDGEQAYESTPLHYPRAVAVDAGAGTSTGTFSIIPVWRFVDRAGRVHRIPGEAVSIGPITTQQIDVYVSICPGRAFGSATTGQDMEPEIYINDGTAGNASLYYLANTSGAKDTYDTTTLDIWYKFTDVQPGSSANPPYPYSTSGEIAPEPPPPMSDLEVVVDRVIGINAEDHSEIWHSKPITAGYGVEWSSNNKYRIEDDCTKVISMGGGQCVLARGGIYLVTGEGPNANGLGSFSPAVKLNSSVDCIDPASVCKTPIGVVFRGRRGFYLLDNGLNAQPWAVPIDPEVLTDPSLDPSVSASYRMRVVYQEATNEIHIVQTPQGGGAYKFVYNLLEQKWSRYVLSGSVPRDIAVARGKLWQLTRVSGSQDYLRDELLYATSGASYNSDADTQCELDFPWLEPHGGGLIRLWRLWPRFLLPSDAVDITSIALDYYIDNVETIVQTQSWSGAELAACYSAGEQLVQLPFHVRYSLVRSFKVVLRWTFSGASSGPKPLKMRMRWAPKDSKGKRLLAAVKG